MGAKGSCRNIYSNEGFVYKPNWPLLIIIYSVLVYIHVVVHRMKGAVVLTIALRFQVKIATNLKTRT